MKNIKNFLHHYHHVANDRPYRIRFGYEFDVSEVFFSIRLLDLREKIRKQTEKKRKSSKDNEIKN